jgi:hypothetical protein
VLLLAFLLQPAGEQFPLSPLPMYSSLSSRAFLWEFTDAGGRPVPVITAFGGMFDTSALRKIWSLELGGKAYRVGEEKRKEVAERVVLRAVAMAPETARADLKRSGLKLWGTEVKLGKAGFLSQRTLLVDLPAN